MPAGSSSDGHSTTTETKVTYSGARSDKPATKITVNQKSMDVDSNDTETVMKSLVKEFRAQLFRELEQ